MRLALPFTLLFFTLLTGWQCKESIVADDSDKNFPVSLRLNTDNDVRTFEWDLVQVSNFQNYVLVKDSKPIPSGAAPVASKIVFKSEDINTLRFEDTAPTFSPLNYYKLYVQVGERFVESDNVQHSQNTVKLFDGQPVQVRILPDSNWMVILSFESNLGTAKMELINYKTGNIINTKGNISQSQAIQASIVFGRRNNQPVLIFLDANGSINSYSLPGFNLVTNTFSFGSPFSAISNGSNLLFYTQFDFTESFVTRNAGTLQQVGAASDDFYFQQRSLLLLNPVGNLVLSATSGRLEKFNVSNTGLVSNRVQKTTIFSSSLDGEIPVSTDRSLFMPYREGVIFNQNLEEIARLPGATSIVDATFSLDNQHLYVASFMQSNGNAILLQKFSLPDMELEREQIISDALPEFLRYTPDGLLLVGFNINQTNKYAVTFLKNW